MVIFSLDPGTAAVSDDDAAHIGQTYTSALEFTRAVQLMEAVKEK